MHWVILFVVLVLAIPIGGYFAADKFVFRSQTAGLAELSPKDSNAQEVPDKSPLEELKDQASDIAKKDGNLLKMVSAKEATGGTGSTFGPTLDLAISLEGRPTGKYGTKLFVGLAEGNFPANPKYLLSYLIEMPESGVAKGLSLTGLTEGKTYTAYLKSTAQLATPSAFTLKPKVNSLNNGNKIELISGDLNEDNLIDESDLEVAQAAVGSNPTSTNWNENIDFNLDNFVNQFDVAIVKKNMGKKGINGGWYSTPPASNAQGGPMDEYYESPAEYPSAKKQPKGYWMWIPKI